MVKEDSRRKGGSLVEQFTRQKPWLSTHLEEPITGNIAKITMTFHNFDDSLQSKDVFFEFDIVNDTA